MNEISPIIKISGDNKVGASYIPFAKQKLNSLLELDQDYLTKVYPLVHTRDKRVNVSIIVKITPEVHYIIIDVNEKKNRFKLSSGLSREELNYIDFEEDGNKFIYFYPQGEDQDFQPWEDLFVNYEVSDLYQKNFDGQKVNKAHYIFGNQFTGEMRDIVQILLGTKINIEYKSDWANSDGIYTDSEGGKWLINISPKGVFVRNISYEDLEVPENEEAAKAPDGIAINYELDTNILNTDFFYQNQGLAPNIGWAFNQTGNEIQNTCIKPTSEKFRNKCLRYKIRIIEDDSVTNMTLKAEYELMENGDLPVLDIDTFLLPKLDDSFDPYVPITTNNNNYYMSKMGSYYQFYFLIKNTFKDLEDKKEYKAPILVYYNEKDEEQVVYHYIKKENKEPKFKSENGVENYEDFFYRDGLYLQVKKLGNFTVTNDNIQEEEFLNSTLTHGFMINNDKTTLSEDNMGDIITDYDYNQQGSFNNPPDTFLDDVDNNRLPKDLRPYRDFNLSMYLQVSKEKIDTINSFIDEYYFKYINTDRFVPGNLFSTYNVVLQQRDINYRLSSLDILEDRPLERLEEVTDFQDIPYKKVLQIRDIGMPILLYPLDNTVIDKFNYFINKKQENEDTLDSIISLLQQIDDDFVNIRQGFTGLQNYLKTLYDPKFLNINLVNEAVKALNENFITPLNEFIEGINDKIKDIKDIFDGEIIDNLYKNYEEYTALVEAYSLNYSDSAGNNYAVMLQELGTIVTSQSQPSQPDIVRTEDTYFAGRQVTKINYIKKQVIVDRKISNNAILLNYKNRNSFTVFTQTKEVEELNYLNYVNNNVLENEIKHNDFSLTNQFRFYRQTMVETNGVKEYLNVTPVDGPAFNIINKTVEDYQGQLTTFTYPYNPDMLAPNKLLISVGEGDYTSRKGKFLLGNLSTSFSNEQYTNQKTYTIRGVDYSPKFNDFKFESEIVINTYTKEDEDPSQQSGLKEKKIIQHPDMEVDDARIFYADFNYETDINLKYNNHYGKFIKNGSLFFYYAEDVFDKRYVINNGPGEYGRDQGILTNITYYPNIYNNNNVYPVNFLGKPFSQEDREEL